MSKAKHVAVLMGGWSAEREVSLNSGKACANALRGQGYQVTEIDVTPTIAQDLERLRPDVIFNALHGRWGEDGCIQGIFEILRIPYTHSGVLASALAMDKVRAKKMFRAAGVPVAEGVVANRFDAVNRHVMKPPYVIKPIAEGSSVGIYLVMDEDAPPPPVLKSENWPGPDEIMVERYVHGRELTCAVMGDVALGVTEIIPMGNNFYDYDAKYTKGGSTHVIPAEISPNIYQRIQKLTLKAHRALGCRGVSRTDFRFDDRFGNDGELVCLEINTQPGMTETSLVPELVENSGYSFAQLVSWMVEDASCGR
jgi:D-alanine-D-alanine ligase